MAEIENLPGLETIKMFSQGLVDLMVEKLEPRVTAETPISGLGMKKTLLGPQAVRVEALAAQLEAPEERTALLQGEMGVGKTLMGLAVARRLALRANRALTVLVLCPPTLVTTWRDEIRDSLPAGSYIFDNILKGTLPKVSPGTLVFQILTTSKVRQHHSQETWAAPVLFTGSEKRRERYIRLLDTMRTRASYQTHLGEKLARPSWGHRGLSDTQARCPKCGHWFVSKKGEPLSLQDLSNQAARDGRAITCTAPRYPKGYWQSTPSLKQKEEPVCGEVLVRPVATTRGRFDVSIAYWAKKRRKNQVDLVIADEFHSLKNNGIQGKAGRWLATVGRKFLALTGTLTGGYAHDLFYLLWALSYKDMKREGYTYSMLTRFCNVYGSHERREEASEKRDKDGRPIHKVTHRRMAGISAAVYEKFLVSKSVFMSLEDLEQDLCPFTEHRVSIPMSEEMQGHYELVSREFRRCIGAAINAGFEMAQPLVSKYLHATLSWPDRLREDKVSETLEKVDDKGKVIDTLSIEINLDDLLVDKTPKDQWLIDLVRKERYEGRKVLAYYTYSNERDCGARIKAVLEKHGIRASLLRSGTVSADKRKEWIDGMTPEIDILLCHPELVKEGLNLVDYPTIVCLQPDYNLYRLRQSVRRSRRLTQKSPVHVYYVYYEDCTQESAMALIASKLDTALLAEGNPADSALFEISYSPDSVFRSLINALSDGNIEALKLKSRTVQITEEITEDDQPLSEPAVTVSEPEGGIVRVSIRKKVGRRIVTVTEEVAVDEVELGAQLALF